MRGDAGTLYSERTSCIGRSHCHQCVAVVSARLRVFFDPPGEWQEVKDKNKEKKQKKKAEKQAEKAATAQTHATAAPPPVSN